MDLPVRKNFPPLHFATIVSGLRGPVCKVLEKKFEWELSWLVISAVIKNLLIWLKCIKAKQTKIFGVKKPPQVPELVKKIKIRDD